jgi:hypothetical protein
MPFKRSEVKLKLYKYARAREMGEGYMSVFVEN